MIAAGNNQSKKSNPFSPKSPVVNLAPRKAARSRGGFCRSLNDCMGSSISTSHHNQHRHSKSNLEQQVVDLEREVLKQKELRIMYRKRMERTHDYLKYCLHVAQDNGFLDLILNKNKYHHHQLEESPDLPSTIDATGNGSPQFSPPFHQQQQPDLAAVIRQSKINGWYIHHTEIELQDKIGQGSTAIIYRANWRGLDVAVKCILPEMFISNESGVAFFAQELDTLSRQRHRFVLQLMGACLDPPDHAWLVTEFLQMTLKEWLHGSGHRRKERAIPLPSFEERVAKALEIALAMQYLHEQKPKVIHRDLKPSNIFLDDAYHVKVADFGHARFLSDEEMALTGETGTFVYMAPEVIRCEPYNEKCDVYSFGVILNEIVTGNHPYIETDFGPSKIGMEVAEGNLRPVLPEDPDGELAELTKLICLAWDQDAANRPSFATITSSLKNIQQRILVTHK